MCCAMSGGREVSVTFHVDYILMFPSHKTLATMDIITSPHHCVVGYALNAKKLRKSSHDCSIGTRPVGDESGNTSTAICTGHEWRGGGLADILEQKCFDETHSIRSIIPPIHFVAFDPEIPPTELPKFDVIIHKLTEDIDSISCESRAKLLALEQYLAFHPSTVIVDPIECVRRVVSRGRTCELLRSKQMRLQGTCPFTQPNYMIIDTKLSNEDLLLQMDLKVLKFPVICKPLKACGTPNSHNMVIIVSADDLSMIEPPCVVQQYHDHGNVLYKVYVIDTDVMVFRRRSLPNIAHITEPTEILVTTATESTIAAGAAGTRTDFAVNQETRTTRTIGTTGTLRSVAFDSRRSYPKLQDFFSQKVLAQMKPEQQQGRGDGEDIPTTLLEQFKATAAALSEEFGLTLFGFDAILPLDVEHIPSSSSSTSSSSPPSPSSSTSSVPVVTVIDVNYFPSYKEVRDFPLRLKNYLNSRKQKAITTDCANNYSSSSHSNHSSNGSNSGNIVNSGKTDILPRPSQLHPPVALRNPC